MWDKFESNLPVCSTVQRGAFCQFPFRWIYYYGGNKSTGKETDKTHLCAVVDLSTRTAFLTIGQPLYIQTFMVLK